MTHTILKNFDEVEACGDARSSTQPGNPFFEGWALAGAMRYLDSSRKGKILSAVAIRDAGLVLPVAMDTSITRRITSVARIWAHGHCFDTTPLVHGETTAALKGFFDEMSRRKVNLLRWQNLPLDTDFSGRLLSFLEANRLLHTATKTYRRPMLKPDGQDAEGFLKRHVGKNRLRDLRRRMRRMEETGKVEFRVHDGAHDAEEWCDDFLALESSGWKGEAGTAIACSQKERGYFETLAHSGAASGHIVIHSLLLDQRPIAMTVNFRSGDGLWAYKSAYCEKLAHLAPGIQVELKGTVSVLSDPSIKWFDSCMTSENGILAELWPDRRPIADLLIAVTPGGNPLAAAGGLLWRQYLAVKNATRHTMRNPIPMRE